MFTRYALYYSPPPGPLADFGAHWLGWDLAQGIAAVQPQVPGLDLAQITEVPRKYGFHGTVKPPFHLAEGKTADELSAAAEALCARLPAVALQGLELTALGRFLALTPVGDASALGEVAAAVVKGLDGFRAPMDAAELAKRRGKGLPPLQDQYLRDWGYPHVLEAFRFHLTLTGKCDKAVLAQLRAVLPGMLAPVLEGPLRIDSLTLAGQRADGMFAQIRRFALRG
ncbi:MAG: DUF1045 domain-containing protein [Sulfitobacter sp.]